MSADGWVAQESLSPGAEGAGEFFSFWDHSNAKFLKKSFIPAPKAPEENLGSWYSGADELVSGTHSISLAAGRPELS